MLKECNLNPSMLEGMKKGSMPLANALATIANYFSVSTDFLLGNEGNRDEYHQVIDIDDMLSEKEKNIIQEYRKLTTEGEDYIHNQFFMAVGMYKKLRLDADDMLSEEEEMIIREHRELTPKGKDYIRHQLVMAASTYKKFQSHAKMES